MVKRFVNITNRLTPGILLALLLAISADANERYSQMVIPFTQPKAFESHYHEAENTLLITIKDTLAQDLDPIYHYDERLIRRVLMREVNAADTELRLVLRDHNVVATVYSFEEPFRLVIDLFDQSFHESRDPQTGLPLVMDTKSTSAQAPSTSPRGLLLEPSQTRERRSEPSDRTSRRRLLQPSPADIGSPQSLTQSLAEAPEGLGRRWAEHPVYVFRIQTAPYKTGKSYDNWMRENARKALESEEAMANYAGQLYDFGHEARALLAYQKVLHQNPLVFDKRADHLWRLSEIHLGQGNLTLADGYYSSMLEKHPDHPLGQFARMRRLDIQIIQAIQRGSSDQVKNLAAQIESIRVKDLPELEAQLNIRRAYWQGEHLNKHLADRHWLPALNPNLWVALENSRPNAENTKTAFIISTLLLNAYLNEPGRWDENTGKFAHQYFSDYRGSAAEPFRTRLHEKTHSTINKNLKRLVEDGQLLQAVRLYESLPTSLNQVGNSAETTWHMAEAYRQLQQAEPAAKFYQAAAEQFPPSKRRFRSLFWQMEMLHNQIQLERSKGSAAGTITRLENQYRNLDGQTMQAWSQLKDDEKQQLMVELQPELEQALSKTGIAQTHPSMLLWAWSQSLSTATPAAASQANPMAQRYRADEQTVFILSRMANRFAQLGKSAKQRQSKNLIRYLQPGDFRQNQEAQRLWARELVELAEIHRQNNDYLEAGRLYTLTGSESANWEGRAEALYKGGLLLYRSGRRQEALEAFNKAASDGNNLLYAELAKKRLEQLQE